MTLRILPKSVGAWARFSLSVALLCFLGIRFHADAVVRSWFYAKQEGDILFQSLPHGDLVDAIEGVTQSPWSHCGVLIQRDGRWLVVEALGEVRETPLTEWIVRSREGRFAAYRVKGLSADDRERVKAALGRLMGRPYDFNYAPDDETIYCSELAYKAYDSALRRPLGQWEKLRNLNWKPFEAFIRSMEGGALPLDRPMITPAALAASEELERIHP
jgi:hypothetical protein